VSTTWAERLSPPAWWPLWLALLGHAAGVALLAAPPPAESTPDSAPAQACSAEPAGPDPASLLPNGRRPLPGVLTGGAPSVEQVARIAAAGFSALIDLRPDAEIPNPAQLAATARAHSLRYERLPVAGAEDLVAAKAIALGSFLADRSTRPLAICCGSGNRAGALLALELAWVEGMPAEEALAVGRAAGLTRLEPEVRALLGLR
jgi:uncharacterized protein (TIGR01244 family)